MAFNIRDMPRQIVIQLKAAAALADKPLKTYVIELFEEHIQELKRKGVLTQGH